MILACSLEEIRKVKGVEGIQGISPAFCWCRSEDLLRSGSLHKEI